MLKIAINNNISITPVFFDFIDSKYGVIPDQNYCIKIGETLYDTDYTLARMRVRKFFNETRKEFRENKYNRKYRMKNNQI